MTQIIQHRAAIGLDDWHVKGSYFEACNCEAICPCRWQGGRRLATASSYGVCDFALSWRVLDGHAGNRDLGGLCVVMAGIYGDGLPWHVSLYVDERADAAQYEALTNSFLGRAGGTLLYSPWNDSENDTIADALIESESRGEELLDLPAFSRATLAVTFEQVNAAARRYYRPELLKVVAIGALPPSGEKSPFAPGAFRASFEP
jgi:hypothetical protein